MCTANKVRLTRECFHSACVRSFGVALCELVRWTGIIFARSHTYACGALRIVAFVVARHRAR